MTSIRVALAASVFLACLASVPAQCPSVATPLTGATWCSNAGGPMFDIVALNPAGVHITGFSVNLNAGTTVIDVYLKNGGGTFAGSELNATAWTLIATGTAVSTANGVATPVPLSMDVFIPPGATQGFHVRAQGPGLRYTSTTAAVGSVLAGNADLNILVGSTQCSLVTTGIPPFAGSVPTPRVFNGIVHYGKEWQLNSPASYVEIDGVLAQACTPAFVTKTQGAPALLTLASANFGFGFEAVLATAPMIAASAGALQTANRQILNVDVVGSPVVLFLNGGSTINFGVPFPGTLVIPFAAPPLPGNYAIQMAVLDPVHPDGIVLSQGSQLTVL